MSVHCPRRDESVDVDECLECERFTNLGIEENEIKLSCEHGGGSEDRPWTRASEPGCAVLANEIPVTAIMQGDVVCVKPEMPVEAVLALMLERGFGGVPVVDADGRSIGVVSRTDLLRQKARDEQPDRAFESRATVGDLMTPLTLGLQEDSSVAQAAALMACEGVHRLPIVSSRGEVVGIVSPLDILRLIASVSGYDVP